MQNTINEAVASAEKLLGAKGWELISFNGRTYKEDLNTGVHGVLIAKGAGYSKKYSVHRFTMIWNGFQLWAGSYDLELEQAKNLALTKSLS